MQRRVLLLLSAVLTQEHRNTPSNDWTADTVWTLHTVWRVATAKSSSGRVLDEFPMNPNELLPVLTEVGAAPVVGQ